MNYKKATFFSLLACAFALFISNILHTNHAEIITSQGKPSKALLQVLSLTGIDQDGSLNSIVQATQVAWIRKPGIERWEIVDKDRADATTIRNTFVEMGLVNEVYPAKKKYNYALWMGGLYERMDIRLRYLVRLWQQGIRYDQIVILSGARALTDVEKEQIALDFNLQDDIPATEADAMQLVYKKTAMPDDMRKATLVVVDTPMQVAKNGNLVRPTTGDTVNTWMELQPKQGLCLVISNQPYVAYQDSVIKSLLPEGFSVETVGEKSLETSIDTYLDTLARLLYQEQARINKRN